jgi:hypothetical protein
VPVVVMLALMLVALLVLVFSEVRLETSPLKVTEEALLIASVLLLPVGGIPVRVLSNRML